MYTVIQAGEKVLPLAVSSSRISRAPSKPVSFTAHIFIHLHFRHCRGLLLPLSRNTCPFSGLVSTLQGQLCTFCDFKNALFGHITYLKAFRRLLQTKTKSVMWLSGLCLPCHQLFSCQSSSWSLHFSVLAFCQFFEPAMFLLEALVHAFLSA